MSEFAKSQYFPFSLNSRENHSEQQHYEGALPDEEQHAQPDPLIVTTTAGQVCGLFEQLPSGQRVRSWRGIPYGADTAGERRFRAPSPVAAWSGVRQCTEFGPVAPQPTYSWTDRVIGSEDCLHLDIVRPDTEEVLPVVVYLHGGSFIVGASHMLMLRGFHLSQAMDVVYVSINFRLGALGYLDMRHLRGDACANPAVADQLLALQWVQDNIARFGGDPASVTLMGESAGGAAVLTLMTSPYSEGLFHRAIAQSPPIGMVHSRTQSTLWARELVRRLALPRLSTVDDVRAQDYADVVRAGQSMMWNAGELLHLNSCFAPTVDHDLVPLHPLVAFKEGKQLKIPLVIGTNADEASFGKFLFQREFARHRAGLRLLSSFDEEGAKDVVAAYGGATTRSDFAELLADALFWAPSIRVADAHAADAPTWMYRYDYAPLTLRFLGLGAIHSLELGNIFGDPSASRASFLTRMDRDAEAERLTEVMQEHWRRFIHDGTPGQEWPPYVVSLPGDPADRVDADELDLRSTLIFDVPSQVLADPKPGKRVAWENYQMVDWGAGRPELAAELGFILEGLEGKPGSRHSAGGGGNG